MLVESGSMDPNSTYPNAEGHEIPVLIGASLHGRLNVAESLIGAGADVDKATINGNTALMAG
jgi:ankyrin repeat protein